MADKAESTYVVQKGDNVPTIAGKVVMEAFGKPSNGEEWRQRMQLAGVESQAIADRNGLGATASLGHDATKDVLKVGQQLIIPDPKQLYARMEPNTPR